MRENEKEREELQASHPQKTLFYEEDDVLTVSCLGLL